MAVNRFWNQPQTAEYSPMSMQELSYAPEIMYKRDEDLTAKVDAMNEAQATLSSMLGDKAGKNEEFKAGYQKLSDRINREGATKANLDLAKNLKQIYIKEVLPQEQYAKTWESTLASQMKDRSDSNKIIIGPDVKGVTYDQWRKDPTAMQYQVAERDKAMQVGRLQGNAWKSGNQRFMGVDEAGKAIYQEGMVSAEEVARRDVPGDPYHEWVNKQVEIARDGMGVKSPNPELDSSIRAGILMDSVGKQSRETISEYERDRMAGKVNGSAMPSGIKVVDFTPMPVTPAEAPGSNFKVDKENMLLEPGMKTEYDKQISVKSGKYFSSIEALRAERERIENLREDARKSDQPISQGSISGMGFSVSTKSPKTMEAIADADFRLKRLDEIESATDASFYGASGWDKSVSIGLNKTNSSWLKPEEQKAVSGSIEGAGEDISKYFSTFSEQSDKSKYGGVSPADIEKINQATDKSKSLGNVKATYRDLRVNGDVVRDKDGKIVGVNGTGQMWGVFDLTYTDKSTKKDVSLYDVVMKLPPSMTEKLMIPLEVVAAHHNSDDSEQLRAFRSSYNKYLERQSKLENSKVNK